MRSSVFHDLLTRVFCKYVSVLQNKYKIAGLDTELRHKMETESNLAHLNTELEKVSCIICSKIFAEIVHF